MGILETAKEYIGKVTYKFGANDPDKGTADCSSFTSKVFKRNGITIGRTTQEQYKKGKEVSKEEARPGDLIFFKDTYDSNYVAGVSHVGIVVGNGMMIDCGSKGVTMRTYQDDYWSKHFLAIKRIDGVDVGSIPTDTNLPSITPTKSDIGLNWWGDIVVVVILIILVIISVLMLMLALGVDKEVLPI